MDDHKPVVLAHEGTFRLGPVLIEPGIRRISRSDSDLEEILEPRVMQVLVALARDGSILSRDDLIHRCWEGRVVGEDAITRVASRLRRLAETIGRDAFRIETITKVGYRLVPLGSESENNRTPDRVAGRLISIPGRFAIAAFVAIVAVALGLTAWAFWLAEPEPGPAEVRLGQFANLSTDLPADLPESVRDEIMAAFDMNDAVRVSLNDGRNEEVAPNRYLLDGTIRSAGDNLRFSLRLTQESSGVVLWSRAYDVPAAERARAARQIALPATQTVRCGLWGAATHPNPLSPETLSLYLQFCQELWSEWNLPRLLDVVRRITAVSPTFSRGWSGRAWVMGLAIERREHGEDDLRQEGIDAASEALRLDPDNSEAVLAQAMLVPHKDYARREQLHLRALENASGDERYDFRPAEHRHYGDFLASVGRLDEALEHYRRAHVMLPLSWYFTRLHLTALYGTDRQQDMDELLDQALERWPQDSGLHRLRALRAITGGSAEGALQSISSPYIGLRPEERAAWRATVEAVSGGEPSVEGDAAQFLLASAQDPITNGPFVINGLAALGRDEAALAAARRLISAGEPASSAVLFDPALARLRRSEAFAELVGQLGLVSYWRSTGRWPDFCQESPRAPACAGFQDRSASKLSL